MVDLIIAISHARLSNLYDLVKMAELPPGLPLQTCLPCNRILGAL